MKRLLPAATGACPLAISNGAQGLTAFPATMVEPTLEEVLGLGLEVVVETVAVCKR